MHKDIFKFSAQILFGSHGLGARCCVADLKVPGSSLGWGNFFFFLNSTLLFFCTQKLCFDCKHSFQLFFQLFYNFLKLYFNTFSTFFQFYFHLFFNLFQTFSQLFPNFFTTFFQLFPNFFKLFPNLFTTFFHFLKDYFRTF